MWYDAVGMVVEKSNVLTTLKTVTLKVMWKRRIHVLKRSMERYSSREITSTFFKYSNSCLSQTLSIVTLLCALLTITIKQGFSWREFTRTFHTGNQFFQNSPKCGDLVSYLKSQEDGTPGSIKLLHLFEIMFCKQLFLTSQE